MGAALRRRVLRISWYRRAPGYNCYRGKLPKRMAARRKPGIRLSVRMPTSGASEQGLSDPPGALSKA